MKLAISSFQNRMAKQLGISPGQEMIQGIDSAEEIDAELVLADRNIQITFARIWHGIGFSGKAKLLMQIIFSIFSNESITEEELEKMKSQDMLNAMLDDFTESFPRLKTPLIDERDQYLAEKIKQADGNKIVAVLGAAHVPGIKKEIRKEQDLDRLTERPPKSKVPKIIGWGIPIFILAVIGAFVALAHPLAILTAFIAAPITSLNPLIASGFFAGFVQAYIRRPSVADFEHLSEDVHSVKGFWNNKVTRILLVVLLANLG